MNIVKFRNLVSSYLEFTLKDIGGKEIYCYDNENTIIIVIKYRVDKTWYTVHLYMYYTEDIQVFDSEMLSIANQIEEMINYERNNYDR